MYPYIAVLYYWLYHSSIVIYPYRYTSLMKYLYTYLISIYPHTYCMHNIAHPHITHTPTSPCDVCMYTHMLIAICVYIGIRLLCPACSRYVVPLNANRSISQIRPAPSRGFHAHTLKSF